MKKKLLDTVRDKIRAKHYSISTEKTYLYWIKYYILFHNKTHPVQMEKPEIESFLTYLAAQKKVFSSHLSGDRERTTSSNPCRSNS